MRDRQPRMSLRSSGLRCRVNEDIIIALSGVADYAIANPPYFFGAARDE